MKLPLLSLVPMLAVGSVTGGGTENPNLAAFREARFGLFIHWGLYSLLGGRWQGQAMDYIGEWIQSRYRIPSAEYAKLAEQFNPTAFDADAWAQSAADAGMTYVVLTLMPTKGRVHAAGRTAVEETPVAGTAGERLGSDDCRVTARGAFTAWHHVGDAIAWQVKLPESGRWRVSVWTETWDHSRPWAGDRRVRVEVGVQRLEADLVKTRDLPHTVYDRAVSDLGELTLPVGEATVRVSTVSAGPLARFFDLSRVVLTKEGE